MKPANSLSWFSGPGVANRPRMGPIGILELRRRRKFIHAAMREAASTAAPQMASGVPTLPTAALPHDEIERWATTSLPDLLAEATRLRDIGHGNIVSYSRKVFIPLTRLCRDTCRYCTFVRGPSGAASAYLSPDEVLVIARDGADAGCQEALF